MGALSNAAPGARLGGSVPLGPRLLLDVRFASRAELVPFDCDVRSYPESGH